MSAPATLSGRSLVPGDAHGSILPLRAPLNLWSGLNPVTGRIVDRGHPDEGTAVTGTILVIPALSGATGGASLAESLRQATGPAGVLVTAADPSLVLAIAVARELYDVRCPLVQIARTEMPALHAATAARVHADGRIELDGWAGIERIPAGVPATGSEGAS